MNLSIILMLPLAVVLVGLARFAMWLFPEQTGNSNHYDGNFGDTDQTLRPLDDLSNDNTTRPGRSMATAWVMSKNEKVYNHRAMLDNCFCDVPAKQAGRTIRNDIERVKHG